MSLVLCFAWSALVAFGLELDFWSEMALAVGGGIIITAVADARK